MIQEGEAAESEARFLDVGGNELSHVTHIRRRSKELVGRDGRRGALGWMSDHFGRLFTLRSVIVLSMLAPPLLYLERAHVLIVFALPSKALAIADAPGLAPA